MLLLEMILTTFPKVKGGKQRIFVWFHFLDFLPPLSLSLFDVLVLEAGIVVKIALMDPFPPSFLDGGFLKMWFISKLVEGQRAGIFKMPSDFRVPEGKSSCLQS